MAHKLTKELYDEMTEKIVNEDILDPELRDIYPVVIDTLKQLPDLVMLGYRKEQIDPEKRFSIEMQDLIQKKGQNRKKRPQEYIDYNADLNKTKIDILRVFFIVSPKLISDSAKDTAITNTKYRIDEVEDRLDVVYDSELKEDILTREDKYDSTKEKDLELDLVLEVPLLMPRLINDQYFLLDGRKYFSAFYMQKVGRRTKKGKLEVVNIMPRPYNNNDELHSYIWVNDNDIIRYQFLGKILNPFVFLPEDTKVHEKFPDLFETKKKAKNEQGEILKNTYKLWKKSEKRSFYEEREKKMNDNTEKDFLFKLIDQVNPKEIENAIYNVLFPEDHNNEMVFDIHKSLRKFLKIEILNRIPNFRGTRRDKADRVKSRININPEVVIMTIKKQKQYSSTVADSANTIDIYKQFNYISELGSGSQIGDGPRRFRPEQLGIIDPIATSTSGNLGLNKAVCYSNIADYKTLNCWNTLKLSRL